MSMNDVVNSFYARGEAEELTISTISKTMHDIMNNTMPSMNDYQQYQPIAEELAHYVVKLMSQHKKPFVSQQQARTFMDFGNQFEVEDRDYWRHVVSSLTETVTDMKVKDILSVLTQMKEFG